MMNLQIVSIKEELNKYPTSVNMLKLLVLLSISVAVLGFPQPTYKSRSRIVGGHDVDITEHPWQVSIEAANALKSNSAEDEKKHWCGGSIISENYIVTAGHCANNLVWLPSDFAIVVNTSIVESATAQRFNVSKIHQHPNWTILLDNDITILELATPLKLGPGIQPIKLPKEGSTPLATGTPVTITGWGLLSEDDEAASPQLQLVEVNIVEKEECRADYLPYDFDLTESMICAAVPEGNKGSCDGDSGGPVVVNGTLYGVVSWSIGCAKKDNPDVNSDILFLRSFITEITGL